MYRFTVDPMRNLLHLMIREPLSEQERQEGMRELYRLVEEELQPGAVVISDFGRSGTHRPSTYDRVAVEICAEKTLLGIRIATDTADDASCEPQHIEGIPYPMVTVRDLDAAEEIIRRFRANASPYRPDPE